MPAFRTVRRGVAQKSEKHSKQSERAQNTTVISSNPAKPDLPLRARRVGENYAGQLVGGTKVYWHTPHAARGPLSCSPPHRSVATRCVIATKGSRVTARRRCRRRPAGRAPSRGRRSWPAAAAVVRSGPGGGRRRGGGRPRRRRTTRRCARRAGAPPRGRRRRARPLMPGCMRTCPRFTTLVIQLQYVVEIPAPRGGSISHSQLCAQNSMRTAFLGKIFLKVNIFHKKK